LRTNARFDPFFLRLAQFKVLFRACADIRKSAAAFDLPGCRNQLRLETFEISACRLLLREQLTSFNIVEDRERLPSSNPISNLHPDFHDPATSQRSNQSDPAVDGLDGSCDTKVFVQLCECSRGNLHSYVLLC